MAYGGWSGLDRAVPCSHKCVFYRESEGERKTERPTDSETDRPGREIVRLICSWHLFGFPQCALTCVEIGAALRTHIIWWVPAGGCLCNTMWCQAGTESNQEPSTDEKQLTSHGLMVNGGCWSSHPPLDMSLFDWGDRRLCSICCPGFNLSFLMSSKTRELLSVSGQAETMQILLLSNHCADLGVFHARSVYWFVSAVGQKGSVKRWMKRQTEQEPGKCNLSCQSVCGFILNRLITIRWRALIQDSLTHDRHRP